MDWTATILAVTGTAADPAYPLDGVDLMRVCRGGRTAGDRTLFWRTVEHAAARSGKWKYLADKDGEYLFDLSVDPGEKGDLRTSETVTFDRLKREYVVWDARMLPRPKEHGRVRP
jgi:arylsulfatase A-like enzyme